jgi:hypothetical protein
MGDDMDDIKSYLIKTAYENEEVRRVFLPLLSLKTASEEELVSRTIRLAHEYPALREYVLPFFGVELFKEAGSKGNKGKRKQDRRRDRQMKNRRRQQALQKGRGMALKMIGVTPVNQSAFEQAMKMTRGRLQGGDQRDYAFSTIWGYAMDPAAKLQTPAAKVMKAWIEKWNQSEAKKKVQKAGEMAGQVLATSKEAAVFAGAVVSAVSEMLEEASVEYGARMEEAGKNLAQSAEATLKEAKEDFDTAKAAISEALDPHVKAYTDKVDEELKKTLEKQADDLNMSAQGVESTSSAFSHLKEAASTTLKMAFAGSVASTKKAGAEGAAGLASNSVGALGGAPKGLLGAMKGLVAGVLSSGGSKLQGKTAADHEEAKQAVIKYLSLVDAEDIEYVQKFINEDDVLDVDALKADLDKKNAEFEKALLAEIEASTKKVEEEAKKEDKEVEKKEVRVIERELGEDAFVAKTAVLKLAYENPKYRPQLLQLLQVPRSHYAIGEIRDLLQRG